MPRFMGWYDQYDGTVAIILQEEVSAIKFKCCNKYYPCYKCHNRVEKHAIKRWSEPSFNQKAILCGVSKHELTMNEYMMVEHYPIADLD